MTPELLLALVAFAFVTSITPGPNNLMLLASGAAFGFRRSVPHMLGVGIGFVAMTVLVGLGLAGLIEAAPGLRLALKAAGRRLHAVVRLEDPERRRAGRGRGGGAADALPRGGAVPVGEPEGLGDGADRGDRLRARRDAAGDGGWWR